MALIKKNIWFIFYILTMCSTILLGMSLYIKWQNTLLKYQTSQENVVELISNATHSLFSTQEQLLDILGVVLLEHDNPQTYNEHIAKHVKPFLDNPYLVALGVTTPSGDFLYANTHDDPTKVTNLMQIPESRVSFLEALQSPHMVFGRTYLSPPLQKWGMPIRKAIRDKEGNPAFVITLLLKINGVFDHLLESLHHRQNLIVHIIRQSDGYEQFNSLGKNNPEKFYSEPMAKSTMDAIYTTIFETFNLSPKELQTNELLISTMYQNSDNNHYLASLRYNQTYHLWTMVHTNRNVIVYDFLQTFFLYSIVYLISGVLFFLLFRIIARAEKKRRDDLLFQATHDDLTKLPNRSYLEHTVPRWIYKKAPSFSLFYIDMDHFKNINNCFGHQFGDYVLIEIAKRLRAHTQTDALITRYGGDEFVVLLHCAHQQETLETAQRLVEVLCTPYRVHDLQFDISASIGIATYPEHGTSLDTLLRAADIALHESKKIKNSIYLFANTMQEGFLKNITIEQELRKAIKNDELFLVYQPQFDAQGSLYGVETLLRWKSPTMGFIPPNHFIPLAEAAGLMQKIGRFIIERACLEMKTLHVKLLQTFQVSLNISVRQFMEPRFFEHLIKTIEMHEMTKFSITLEVTENLFIEDIHYILPLLEQLRALGLKISMDDFGTGYSSLSMLRKLPIDELKIDKSFVDEICQDTVASKMVQNIIAIGKNFGMTVLAEGVETQAQKEALIHFGCDHFQGYYFAKPLTIEELELFLLEHLFTCKT